MNGKEFDYEKLVSERKEVAKIINNDIFLAGLGKLNQEQLIDIIGLLVHNLDYYINVLHCNDYADFDCDERDFKDIDYDCKCLIIELLYPNFFKDKEI